jgi:phenylacetate-coenzyme A ligase PaaK-like adenylate-forming protein
MTMYDELRQRHTTEAMARLSSYAERLSWTRAQIRRQRESDLRRLVRGAVAHSPWHRDRLAHLDPDRMTEADLAHLPPMTKDDLMSNFDTVVTDSRVTLEAAEHHVETLETDAYFLDEFHVFASGGSSGRRGVFVYGWDAWALCYVGYMRHMIRTVDRFVPDAGSASARATVAAARASHMTGAIRQTFSGSDPDHAFPVTLPLADIVNGLNEVRPAILTGYASALLSLAHEARAGRLDIAPRLVVANAEPLLPEIRSILDEVWGVPVINAWGTTEGCLTAIGCGVGDGMHLSDDLLIVEPVDAAGHPVAPGERSAKVYLTNLFNDVLPLIRYEITDEVVVLDEPCPCGLAFDRVADILGRLDDTFVYGVGQTVHPHVFRSALGRDRRVAEYQVRQTLRGAAIAIRATAAIDTAMLQRYLVTALAGHGVRDPEVVITMVDHFDRTAVGKLKRFVPLQGA